MKKNPELWRAGSGCSILSLAAAAVIIILLTTGTLQRTITYFRGEFTGGAAARSHHRMMSNARQLVGALQAYAGDHGGAYPDSLQDLSPDTLSESDLNRLLTEGSIDSPTGEAWILRSDLTTSAPSTAVLIFAATPDASGEHVAGLNDGSLTTLGAEEAARLLEEQR